MKAVSTGGSWIRCGEVGYVKYTDRMDAEN